VNAPSDKHWLIVDFHDDHWADKLDLASFRLIEDFELVPEDSRVTWPLRAANMGIYAAC